VSGFSRTGGFVASGFSRTELAGTMLIANKEFFKVAVVFAVLMSASPVEAICVTGSGLCEDYWKYEAVFDGTVRRIERRNLPDTTGKEIGHRLVTFTVHKAWKGVSGDAVQLLLLGGYEVTISESFDPLVDRRYIVFALKRDDGYLTSNGCAPNVEYGAAGSTLAFLASLDQPATGGRIFGIVTVTGAARSGEREVPPRTLKVTLSGGGVRKVTVAENGKFEFSDLAAGVYDISVDAPPGLTGGGGKLALPDPRACASVWIALKRGSG
jgi:hypothetical protein